MKQSAITNQPGHGLTHTSSGPAEPGPTSKHKLSEEDRAFIRSMNEFVEKHGTITDDDFFRVL